MNSEYSSPSCRQGRWLFFSSAKTAIRISCFALICAVVTGCVSHARSERPSPAKNIILFIGDGMGVSTVTAARIFDGQSRGLSGEEHVLPFETFPHVALVKTYNSNQQVPDSAGTATAMLTGSKTRAGLINLGPDAQRRNCAESLQYPLTSLSELSRQQGKAVGVVTTTRLTHATPSTMYAHSPERDWESDRFMHESTWSQGCRDMAYQLTHLEKGLDIALGGGQSSFFGSNFNGYRKQADADLVSEWLSAVDGRSYVTTKEQLEKVTPGQQVLGLFSRSHMTFVADRQADSTEPSLSDMTRAAIDLLTQKQQGYFLMVEGGRIDHAHHAAKPGLAMLEVQAFSQAVAVALQKVDLSETLILVTADHSHVFTMAGYPVRGNPILGLVVENDTSGESKQTPALDTRGVPYTTLGYANGPGAIDSGEQRGTPELGIQAVAQSLIPVVHKSIDGTLEFSETHGGEDVALYAMGAGSENVFGVIEQNLIFNIMEKAFGWDSDAE